MHSMTSAPRTHLLAPRLWSKPTQHQCRHPLAKHPPVGPSWRSLSPVPPRDLEP